MIHPLIKNFFGHYLTDYKRCDVCERWNVSDSSTYSRSVRCRYCQYQYLVFKSVLITSVRPKVASSAGYLMRHLSSGPGCCQICERWNVTDTGRYDYEPRCLSCSTMYMEWADEIRQSFVENPWLDTK